MITINGFSQYSEDSTHIEKVFNSILSNADSYQNELSKLNSIFRSKGDSIKDVLDFAHGKYLFRTGQFDKALKIIGRRIEDPFNTSLNDGKYHNLKGAIYSLQNKNTAAVNEFIIATRKYESQQNMLRAALIKNNIANIYFSLNEHDKAYPFIRDCFIEMRKHPYHPYYPSILGVLAISENNIGLLDSSRVHANIGLKAAHNKNDSTALAILNYARGETEMIVGDFKTALPHLKIALSISQQFNLKEYELLSRILLMNANIKKNDYVTAIKHGKEAERISGDNKNKTTTIAIKRGLSKAYHGIKDYQLAYTYQIDMDSLVNERRNNQTRALTDSLLIAFETEKKEKEIVLKDLEITQQENQLSKEKLFFSALIIILISLVIFIVIYIKYKKVQITKQQYESEKAILSAIKDGEEKERKRLSSELHNGLASDLTGLKIQLEQLPDIPKNLINSVADIHKDVRLISHNLSPLILDERGLIAALDFYAQQIDNNKLKVDFTHNIKQQLVLTHNAELLLYRTIQEIIQNALKHANCSEISIQMYLRNNILSISVEDNGKGFDLKEVNDSHGIMSIKSKIKTLGGTVEIDSSKNNGTTFFITINL